MVSALAYKRSQHPKSQLDNTNEVAFLCDTLLFRCVFERILLTPID